MWKSYNKKCSTINKLKFFPRENWLFLFIDIHWQPESLHQELEGILSNFPLTTLAFQMMLSLGRSWFRQPYFWYFLGSAFMKGEECTVYQVAPICYISYCNLSPLPLFLLLLCMDYVVETWTGPRNPKPFSACWLVDDFEIVSIFWKQKFLCWFGKLKISVPQRVIIW